MDFLTDPQPRSLEQRQQDYLDVGTSLDADVEEIKRRSGELQGYIYGLLYEREPFDSRELEGYIESVKSSAEQLRGSADMMRVVADEGQRQRAAALGAWETPLVEKLAEATRSPGAS